MMLTIRLSIGVELCVDDLKGSEGIGVDKHPVDQGEHLQG